MGFPCDPAGKESTCNAGNLGSIPRLGRSPGEGKGYPLQYPGLGNSTDFIVHGVMKSPTQTLQARREWQDIFKVLKGKNLRQGYSTQQGYHSKLLEKSETLQTRQS